MAAGRADVGDGKHIASIGLDLDARPTVEEILKVRADRMALVRSLVEGLTDDDYRAAWDTIERTWAGTTAHARRLPEASLQERVDDEWSVVETHVGQHLAGQGVPTGRADPTSSLAELEPLSNAPPKAYLDYLTDHQHDHLLTWVYGLDRLDYEPRGIPMPNAICLFALNAATGA